MGNGRKVANVLLRIAELACAVIVLGILGHFLYEINVANGPYSPRIVYTEALAAIAIPASIILSPPLQYTFWAFPFDGAMFVMWMTSFGLLVNLTGGHTCTATWYYNYWGYYWGRFYVAPGANGSVFYSAGCSEWRAVLAFVFLGGMIWLVSFFLGVYAIADSRDGRNHALRDTEATGATLRHDRFQPDVSTVPVTAPVSTAPATEVAATEEK